MEYTYSAPDPIVRLRYYALNHVIMSGTLKFMKSKWLTITRGKKWKIPIIPTTDAILPEPRLELGTAVVDGTH